MKTYRGKRIWEGDELPWAVRGSRVLVKPDQPKDRSEGGLVIPEIAQHRAWFGTIIGAGLSALDGMTDYDDRIGDRVCYGQFAGMWEEWDHITKTGDAACDHEWSWLKCDLVETNMFSCKCGAERTVERILIMDVEDLKGNEDAALRRSNGETEVKRIPTASGRLQHQLFRRGEVNPVSMTPDVVATNGTYQNSTAS